MQPESKNKVNYSFLSVDDVEFVNEKFAPGEVIAEVEPIFYGARGWTFAKPGQYTLEAD